MHTLLNTFDVNKQQKYRQSVAHVYEIDSFTIYSPFDTRIEFQTKRMISWIVARRDLSFQSIVLIFGLSFFSTASRACSGSRHPSH